MNLSNFSFKQKIVVLLALPVLAFLFLSGSSISHSVSTTREMASLNQLIRLSVSYSELVHELQKERGMTAGYLGSHGSQFGDELRSQQQATDSKRNQRISDWQSADIDLHEIQQLNDAIDQGLRDIESIRRRVETQSISLPDALAYYTQLNHKLLSVSGLIAEISTNPAITKETVAYYNFLQGKERAGIERAVLSNTFSKDAFTTGMLVKFIALVTEQETYFDNFNVLTNDTNKQYFSQQLNDKSVQEVNKFRELAKAQSSQFDVDPVYWFAQATKRIGQLKKIENEVAASLIKLTEEKYQAAQTSMTVNLIIFLLTTLTVAVVSYVVIKDLTARVNDLTSVMAKVREENDLTARAQYIDTSELGSISSALNSTLAQFSHVIDNLSNSSMTLASAAEETSQTCQYNSTSMVEQQEQIGLIATAIEELSTTVNEVASKTQQTSESAKLADEQTLNGLRTVQHSYQSIEGLAAEIDGLAEKIIHLHDSSNNIHNVVDVIKSVADQTNLLALNAAIEAARAGDQGRGFAVVADEVRKLAQRTQESTAEIEGFINSLRSDVESAFHLIENNQTKAMAAVQDSRNVEQTLEGISESVSQIFSMTEQIATATEEQAVVTQDIAKNIMTVEDKSTESTTGAAQIASTAREQAELATTLRKLANTFKI
ncbi:methyl-accepting chemotaxis protein [Photobacterium sp. MCCC 1A19761]|uniref:methyl-accepting chemotaxis protein n=1 Tax=Photobacterium sp. MCCC 1A19761 TaxID=3115000 RepID=UPI00307D858B